MKIITYYFVQINYYPWSGLSRVRYTIQLYITSDMILSDIIKGENLYVMLASLLHEIFAGNAESK